ncbi:hypothetical protein AGMMS49525_13000 [Bacteroidia bacterium]|nr:hypothetical protein AGMMS49525_13000 [Bacteroidia bacterium]
MQDTKHKNISETAAKILARFNTQGKTWFTLAEAYNLFSEMSENQIRVQVKRMTDLSHNLL